MGRRGKQSEDSSLGQNFCEVLLQLLSTPVPIQDEGEELRIGLHEDGRIILLTSGYHARRKSVRSNSWGFKPDTDTDTLVCFRTHLT